MGRTDAAFAGRARLPMSDLPAGRRTKMHSWVDEPKIDTVHWAAFARRFLAPDSYVFGTALMWVLGKAGTKAVIDGLFRAERVCASDDAFACREAALILVGALEEAP